MKTCIVPGSFDPMTLGHRDIVLRACALFDRVVVAIMHNENKQGRFSCPQRLEIARLTLRDLPAEVCVRDGYLADFAREIGASAIVKGIRNAEDLAYENEMAVFNLARNPECQTVYLPAASSLSEISSTAVYRRILDNASLDGWMAPAAAEYVRKLNR